jgi:hypothetical protein
MTQANRADSRDRSRRQRISTGIDARCCLFIFRGDGRFLSSRRRGAELAEISGGNPRVLRWSLLGRGQTGRRM